MRAYKQPYIAPQCPSLSAYPIVLLAKSAESVRLYLRELRRFVLATDSISIRDVAYSLTRRQNPSFEHRVAFVAGDIADFGSDPEDSTTKIEEAIITRALKRPVVLAFSGQTGRTVTVARDLYQASRLFRRHLVCYASLLWFPIPANTSIPGQLRSRLQAP